MTSEAGIAAAREAAATAQHCLRWLLDETADEAADETADETAERGGDLRPGGGGEMREVRRDAAEMREIRRRAEEELAICLITEAGVLRRDLSPPPPPQPQPPQPQPQPPSSQPQPPQQQRGRRLLRAGHHATAAEAMQEVAQLLGAADADGAPPAAGVLP